METTKLSSSCRPGSKDTKRAVTEVPTLYRRRQNRKRGNKFRSSPLSPTEGGRYQKKKKSFHFRKSPMM